jgi:hypothetical protein
MVLCEHRRFQATVSCAESLTLGRAGFLALQLATRVGAREHSAQGAEQKSVVAGDIELAVVRSHAGVGAGAYGKHANGHDYEHHFLDCVFHSVSLLGSTNCSDTAFEKAMISKFVAHSLNGSRLSSVLFVIRMFLFKTEPCF